VTQTDAVDATPHHDGIAKDVARQLSDVDQQERVVKASDSRLQSLSNPFGTSPSLSCGAAVAPSHTMSTRAWKSLVNRRCEIVVVVRRRAHSNASKAIVTQEVLVVFCSILMIKGKHNWSLEPTPVARSSSADFKARKTQHSCDTVQTVTFDDKSLQLEYVSRFGLVSLMVAKLFV
jgi:hypothetical protein